MNFQGITINKTTPRNDTEDIILPKNTENLDRIGIDIGGSLAKVVYYSNDAQPTGGRLRFSKFETSKIQDLILFVKNLRANSEVVLKSTGGGSVKYHRLLKDEFPENEIEKLDEMDCLIHGLNFVLESVPNEVFSMDHKLEDIHRIEDDESSMFPYLLVNIGSGVSILKVTGKDTFQRISGTSIGGGTLWGILSKLTSAESFDDVLELSKNGNNKNVDMLVGDIYGTDYNKIGLKSTVIASSFGKMFKMEKDERNKVEEADMASSLLFAVSNNIGQIAYLNARLHDIKRVFFSGFFIRGHLETMKTLSFAINFWSKGEMKAYFLRHEGYLGALGAFLDQIHAHK